MYRKPVVPHHGEDGFGFLAHLHLIASAPNATYVEIFNEPPNYSAQVFQTILEEPLLPDSNGDILLPQGPGLGIGPRLDLLKGS